MSHSATAADTLFAELEPLHTQMWRAPSAHNTQPWLLEATDDDGAVRLSWDVARTLPVADPTMRDLFLSLGAFVEQALVVAAGSGIGMAFEPGVDVAQRRAGQFVERDEPYASEFTAQQAAARGCNRGAHEPGALEAEVVAEASALAGRSGCRIEALPARDLVDLLVAADRHMFGDVPTTRELRHWLRLTHMDPNFTRDGLTYTALDMKGSEATALSMLTARAAYPLLRRLGVHRLLASFSRPLLRYDGTVLCLVGPASDEPVGAAARHEAEIAAGRELLRVWLGLERHGVSVHPLSQIIDAPATYDALHAMLGLPASDRVLAIFRAGRPTGSVARSYRLR
jgi:hypothetical protein